MEQEEGAYQAQRRRLYAEVGEEKERLATQATRQRADADRQQRQLEDGQRTAAAAIRDEYERARDEQEKRHDVSGGRCELHQCEGRLSIRPFVYLSLSLHAELHQCDEGRLSVRLSTCPSPTRLSCISVRAVCPSVCLSTCPSLSRLSCISARAACPPVRPSVCLPVPFPPC